MGAKPTVLVFRDATAGDVRRKICDGNGQHAGDADCSDLESTRVLDAAAHELASELGRQAARELWDTVMRETQR